MSVNLFHFKSLGICRKNISVTDVWKRSKDSIKKKKLRMSEYSFMHD